MELPQRPHRPLDLLRLAGVFTWFCAAIPLLFSHQFRDEALPLAQILAWGLLHLLFGGVYWNCLKNLSGSMATFRRLAYLAVLTLTALAINLLSETSIGGILLLIVAGLLPWMLPAAMAGAWLVVQTGLLALVITRIPGVSLADATVTAGFFLGISLFGFLVSLAVVRQSEARDELRKLNSELLATQSLLAENTRIAERVRISRELHDLVGHHLTALTLNLEVVTHLVQGKALEHVRQAHALARLLLADVREVVSDLRKDDKVDLAQALRTLIGGVPAPRIHLEIPAAGLLTDPQRAQVLLRCAQEIITNTVRHAQARNLWLRLATARGGLAMSARDDGRGASRVAAGNGLAGMSERLQALGGKLEIETARGDGFTLHAWIPLEP